MNVRRREISKLSDNELLELYCSTRKQAYFGELYLRYLSCIYGVCLNRLGEAQMVRSAVCELLDQLMDEAGEEIPVESVAMWLYRETVRFCVVRLQKTSHISTSDARFYSERRIALLTILENKKTDQYESLMARWGELTKPQRECLRLFFMEEKSFDEIAAMTGYLSDDIRNKYIESALAHLETADGIDGMARIMPEWPNLAAHLRSYLKGDRTGANAYKIERTALYDPFLGEALQGYTASQQSDVENVEQITRDVEVRFFGKRCGKKSYVWATIGCACVLGVALIIYYAGFSSGEDEADEQQISQLEEKELLQDMPVRQILEPAVDSTAAAGQQVTEIPAPADSTSYGTQERSSQTYISVDTPEFSSPRIGYKLFNEYLQKAAVVSSDTRGDVLMTFRVNKYGRPSEIRVVQGPTGDANREAIRLITSGPEWETTDERVSITIHFR